MHKLSVASPPRLLIENYMIEIARTYKVPFEPDPAIMRVSSYKAISFRIYPSMTEPKQLGDMVLMKFNNTTLIWAYRFRKATACALFNDCWYRHCAIINANQLLTSVANNDIILLLICTGGTT